MSVTCFVQLSVLLGPCSFMPFLTFSCQFNWELTFRPTVVWGGGIDPIGRVKSDYTQLNHRWMIIPRPRFHFYNILNTMTWNLHMFMYHSLSTAWYYPRHSSHTKEKGQAHLLIKHPLMHIMQIGNPALHILWCTQVIAPLSQPLNQPQCTPTLLGGSVPANLLSR